MYSFIEELPNTSHLLGKIDTSLFSWLSQSNSFPAIIPIACLAFQGPLLLPTVLVRSGYITWQHGADPVIAWGSYTGYCLVNVPVPITLLVPSDTEMSLHFSFANTQRRVDIQIACQQEGMILQSYFHYRHRTWFRSVKRRWNPEQFQMSDTKLLLTWMRPRQSWPCPCLPCTWPVACCMTFPTFWCFAALVC